MKFASWYGIGVGALIILQWIFFCSAAPFHNYKPRRGRLDSTSQLS
jgi:hypothetical protein